MRFERFTYTKDDIKGLKTKTKNGLKVLLNPNLN